MIKRTRILKTICALTLVGCMVIPTIALADDAESSAKPDYRHNMERRLHFKESSGKLLEVVEKFSPETLDDWILAIEDRESLHKEMKTVKDSIKGIVGGVRDNKKNGRMERKRELSEELRAKMDELRWKVKSGEITKEEAKAQAQEFHQAKKVFMLEKYKGFRGEHKAKVEEWRLSHQDEIEAFRAKREEMKSLYEELNTAVQANDTDMVKTILEQLLTEFKSGTEHLSSKLTDMQNKLEEIESEQE